MAVFNFTVKTTFFTYIHEFNHDPLMIAHQIGVRTDFRD